MEKSDTPIYDWLTKKLNATYEKSKFFAYLMATFIFISFWAISLYAVVKIVKWAWGA